MFTPTPRQDEGTFVFLKYTKNKKGVCYRKTRSIRKSEKQLLKEARRLKDIYQSASGIVRDMKHQSCLIIFYEFSVTVRKMKYTLSVLVENHAGVLSKVSGLFSRRGFNIDSLAVGITEDSNISRITIVADGDEYVIEQLEKQLNKIIPVIKVRTFRQGEFISRELSLIKVSCPARQRLDVMKIAELMEARIVDVSQTTMTLQFADTLERFETLIDLLKPYGIREIVRTGTVAIEKDSAVARNSKN